MKKISILLLIVFVLSACENDGVGVSIPFNSEYFPLHVGDYWELEQPSGQNPPMGSLKREITKTVTINNRQYYLMTSTYTNHGLFTIDTMYCRVDQRGYIYTLRNNQPRESNPFRLAASDGAKWTSVLYGMEGEITLQQFTTIQLNQTAVDSCKTFSFDAEKAVDEESYTALAPGLGLVSQGSYAWGLSYHLKKAVINGKTFEF